MTVEIQVAANDIDDPSVSARNRRIRTFVRVDSDPHKRPREQNESSCLRDAMFLLPQHYAGR